MKSPLRPATLYILIALLTLGLAIVAFDAMAGGSQASGLTSDQLMVYNGNRLGTDIGDFITGNIGGLDSPYDYYIEVPPGLDRLVVELFDPDILAAVDPDDERDEDRDLFRSSVNTFARYRLFDPDGNQVPTSLGVGGNNDSGTGSIQDTPNPVAWDNSWVTFYDSDRIGATVTTTFIDNFGTVSYGNNDGTGSFAGDWTESDETGTAGASGGIMFVTGGGELSITNFGDMGDFEEQPRIHREVDLSSFTNAVVSFDWSVGTGMEDNDAIIFEVSPDGGTSWVGLDIFSDLSDSETGSASYDITDYIASDTQVRFRVFDFYAGEFETFLIDDFTISAGTAADGADPAAGHWRIEMDMSTEVKDRDSQQEDLNALAIRAHDGTSGSGGTEVNVYALSYFSLGLNNNDSTRSYTMYPYITEGCTFSVNDFDHDSDAPDPVGVIAPPYGSWDLTSRSAAFTDDEAGTLSPNDEWNSEDVTGWNSDNSAVDYGVWEMDMTISDFGSGNYAVYYIGNEDADDPDANGDGTPGPTASPEADTVRIYFPTDANAAPAKPYVTHTVQYEGPDNGPNPPVMGSVTSFAVSLRVVNPTGAIGSISFSNAASRTVTANVPASTTDYEICYLGTGTGFPTSGTIISQPATTCPGTGGTIVWEPAAVAAGTEAQLRYGFTIEPLVATDLIIPVSGTYLSNGTQATFLDETGDTSGAFTFGPLCGLSVLTASPTPVLVSSFEARPQGRGTLLEWKTAAEAGSAFFDLYRHGEKNQRIKVNRKPLLAMLDAPQGGVYRLLDDGAKPDEVNTYSLVETMANGRKIEHGPYTVQVNWTLPNLPMSDGYERTPHPTVSRVGTQEALADLLAPSEEMLKAAIDANIVAPNSRLRIVTGDSGIYRLMASDLAPYFGIGERRLRQLINQGEISLTHSGQSVAWRQIADSAGIDFYAQANSSIYSSQNTYWLEIGSGAEMPTLRANRPPRDWNPDSFRDTRRSEQNLRPIVLVDLDPEGDIWFWDFMRHDDVNHASKNFTVDTPGVADNTATADLTIFLQGASTGQHAVDVEVNGTFIGNVTVQDLQDGSATLPVSQSLLLGDGNSITLTTTAGDLFFVDAFEMSYDRIYEAENDALWSRSDGNRWLALGGFTDPSITVYDLSDPMQPGVLDPVGRLALRDGTYRAIWTPSSVSTPYLAVSDSGILQPVSISVDRPSRLRSPDHRVEHLIIAPSSLAGTAEDLAKYRRSQGLTSNVVDLQDIYDEFSGGLTDLTAIRSFLEYTQENWRVPPRYVVLAGAGTYDYQNYLGLGGNWIPPFLRSDGETLFVTDTPFVDFDDDGIPEMAIGRLPVLSALELQSYIDKVVAYEALDEPEWGSHILLASDNADVADFSETSDGYADLLSVAYQTTKVQLEDFATLGEARQALFDGLNQGAAVLSYLGHGGVDRLAAEGLLTSGDVPNLTNDGRPTVLLAVSCHIGFHGLPGLDSLGEHLVLDPLGGAAAVWAPAWLSQHSEAQFFGDRLFRQLFVEEEYTLGDAILGTLRSAAGLGLEKSLLQTYQLLGDPALEIRLAPDDIPGGPPCEPNCSGG